jgi:hypothetical protein
MPSSHMTLRFTCPSSAQELDYRVPADFKSLAKRWSKPVQLDCPHCGFAHRFLFREGYPGGVLAGFGCAGAHTSITDLLSGGGDAESPGPDWASRASPGKRWRAVRGREGRRHHDAATRRT